MNLTDVILIGASHDLLSSNDCRDVSLYGASTSKSQCEIALFDLLLQLLVGISLSINVEQHM